MRSLLETCSNSIMFAFSFNFLDWRIIEITQTMNALTGEIGQNKNIRERERKKSSIKKKRKKKVKTLFVEIIRVNK